MDYREATEYIERIPMFGPQIDGRNKSGNPNLEYVMKKLGHPEQKRKAVHIAGTNGKGSTACLTAGILCASGYRVGIFTSPHLIRINERIGIMEFASEDMQPDEETDAEQSDKAGLCTYISDEDFAACATTVRSAVENAVREGKLHLSYFEFLFAVAAVYFAQKPLDYVVYETGLGGRLDATNILTPLVTAITSIGLEHTQYLGNTIREIAWEKAGIIKEGVPVIYNTGDDEADIVIASQAELMHAQAINVAKTEYIINEFTDKTIDFSVYNRYYKYNNLVLPAGGAVYQVDNAMTAIFVCSALESLRRRMTFDGNAQVIPQETLQKAFDGFFWSGRMERLHTNIVLDGAHNTDAIERFVESVNQSFGDFGCKLLFAVAEDKDYEPMIERICSGLRLSEVYVTAIDSNRRVAPAYIAGLFRMYLAKQPEGKGVQVCFDDDIRNAFLRGVQSVRGTDDILFCVGSLYLVGSLKQIAAEDLGI